MWCTRHVRPQCRHLFCERGFSFATTLVSDMRSSPYALDGLPVFFDARHHRQCRLDQDPVRRPARIHSVSRARSGAGVSVLSWRRTQRRSRTLDGRCMALQNGIVAHDAMRERRTSNRPTRSLQQSHRACRWPRIHRLARQSHVEADLFWLRRDGRAAVPSVRRGLARSIGLRDGDKSRYLGKAGKAQALTNELKAAVGGAMRPTRPHRQPLIALGNRHTGRLGPIRLGALAEPRLRLRSTHIRCSALASSRHGRRNP